MKPGSSKHILICMVASVLAFAALQGRVDLLPTADYALNTMLISEGIYLSDKLGREVTAEEVAEMSVSTAVKV